MKKSVSNGILRTFKLLNVILISLPFCLCWFLYYAERIHSRFYLYGNIAVAVMCVVLYVIFAKIYDVFSIHLSRISETFYSQMLAIIISDGIMFAVVCLLSRKIPNVLPMVAAFVCQSAIALLWAESAHLLYFKLFNAKKTVVIYGIKDNITALFEEYGLDKRYIITDSVSLKECMENLSVLKGAESVFLTDVPTHARNILMKYCVDNGILVYTVPKIGDMIMRSAKNVHMFHLPVVQAGRYEPSKVYLLIKRIFDILISGIGLIILSPVMLVTAIFIKAHDGGPVFYKQERLTANARVFKIIKFRSMRTDAEADGIARLSHGETDSRITPVGRVIRKLRIDEIPQLINILTGDMSIVGPRPERPEIAAQYAEKLPEFNLRTQAKAGLTGYAQVYGKYNTTPYNKLLMDLIYIGNPSLLEDIRICFATVKIIFMPESTEGTAEGTVTAIDDEYEVSDYISIANKNEEDSEKEFVNI